MDTVTGESTTEQSTTEQSKNGKRALSVLVGEDEPEKRRKNCAISALSSLQNVLIQKGADFLIFVYVEMDVEAADFFSLSCSE